MDRSVTIAVTRAEAAEIVALLRTKAYEESSADTGRAAYLDALADRITAAVQA